MLLKAEATDVCLRSTYQLICPQRLSNNSTKGQRVRWIIRRATETSLGSRVPVPDGYGCGTSVSRSRLALLEIQQSCPMSSFG